MIETVIAHLENLRRQCEGNLKIEEAVAAMLTPVQSAITTAFEKWAANVRILESEVGPQRAWLLIEAYDDLLAITSDDRAKQIEAAKRLALSMIPPKLGRAARGILKLQATGADMRGEGYLTSAVFPDGLLLAVAQIDSPQTVRLGRKWVVGADGKIFDVRPIRDLSIGEFVHWLYSQASKASNAILTERTYPDDPLNRLEKEPGGHDIDQVAISNPGLIVALFDIEMNPTAGKIIAAEPAQEARAEINKLLRKASPKESAMIRKALARGGDLVELLHDMGYSASAIRLRRSRLGSKLPKK